ncbi:replication initiator protein A [Stieleria magnilauensis]|uniref:replication initiator protein A n=1 Tax=Stieleria magnilauensis TaxID=2527963 RepID=UPI003AF59474
MNFAEFPLFYLGQRVPSGLTRLTFESEITDSARNRSINRRIVIEAGRSENVPVSSDMDVLHALIALGKHVNNLASSTIHFSRYQLCEILGWPQNGKSYKRIERALRKWLEVTIYFEAWWDKDDERWRNLKGFHILDDVELNDHNTGRPGRAKQTELPFSSVRIGQRFFDSLSAGYVKRLNLADLFHLSLPTAKRLYGFLDKRFYHKTRLDFDLRTLACEHVGMSRDYKTSELKRKLFPAIEELVDLGFLEPMTIAQRYTQVGHGVYQVHFARATRSKIGTLPLAGNKAKKSTNRQLVTALTKHGMTPVTARQIVEDPGISDEVIRNQIDILEWKLSRPNDYTIGNKGGYLRMAITEDHSPPNDWKPKDERDAIVERAEQAKRKRQAEEEKRLAEVRTKQEIEDAQRRERESRVAAYVATLSPGDYEKMIAAALERTEGFMARIARKALGELQPGSEPVGSLKIVIEDYVLALLDGTADAGR